MKLTSTFKILCFSTAALAAVADVPDLQPRQAGAACAPLELFHLAGTTELGLGIVGNAFKTALPQAVPGATVTAIQYSTAPEFVATVAAGARTTVNTLTARAAACPNTKFVLSGYSKGALVVHQVKLPANVQAQMAAVTVFGDPNLATGLSLAVPVNDQACSFSFCNNNDVFCAEAQAWQLI